ncbi:MAG: flavodoxin family protein [Deltaproteobacteria bacterium]|nr:flavodoxin family protein [Deltaproteobacteria bacterium]
MNILGIICSPRSPGNCELTIKEISRQIPVPHELKLTRLPKLNIQPCQGCYRCLFKEQRCWIQDDLNSVLDDMSRADALIVAVPTYFLGPNASLKLLLDRGLSFYGRAASLWKKPAVGIGIAGIDGKEGYTLLGIQNFLKMLRADIRAVDMIHGALPGEALLIDKNTPVIRRLAKALMHPEPESTSPGCPLCGGDAFRFLEGGKIQCLLCSNSGTLTLENETPVFHIEPGDHDLFLNKEATLKHRDWLIGMKGRYLEKKSELKEIFARYAD